MGNTLLDPICDQIVMIDFGQSVDECNEVYRVILLLSGVRWDSEHLTTEISEWKFFDLELDGVKRMGIRIYTKRNYTDSFS